MFEGTDSVIKSEFNLPTQCKPTDLTHGRSNRCGLAAEMPNLVPWLPEVLVIETFS